MASTKQSSGTSVLKEVVTLGLDLAKTTVYFVGLDATGQVLTRRQYSKGKLLEVAAKMGPCRIGMEACCGSHHLGRQLLAQGHDVKLMPPKYVKPFVKRDKCDGELRRTMIGGPGREDGSMSTSKSRNEQGRADDFEALVERFLKALGYVHIEKHPKIGTKRADLVVTSGEGRFFVEAKSPHLMRGTLFDPDHFARVMQFERDTTRYVKKQFGTLHQNCIMTGSWNGLLARGIEAAEIRKWLEPLKPWVGREKELPTWRDLEKWYGWLESYESAKTYIEHHPELEREAVRIIKSQCPFYDDIPPYPYGRFSVRTSEPRQGKPQEWNCTWRLMRRDRHHPVASGFTFLEEVGLEEAGTG